MAQLSSFFWGCEAFLGAFWVEKIEALVGTRGMGSTGFELRASVGSAARGPFSQATEVQETSERFRI